MFLKFAKQFSSCHMIFISKVCECVCERSSVCVCVCVCVVCAKACRASPWEEAEACGLHRWASDLWVWVFLGVCVCVCVGSVTFTVSVGELLIWVLWVSLNHLWPVRSHTPTHPHTHTHTHTHTLPAGSSHDCNYLPVDSVPNHDAPALW